MYKHLEYQEAIIPYNNVINVILFYYNQHTRKCVPVSRHRSDGLEMSIKVRIPIRIHIYTYSYNTYNLYKHIIIIYI